MEYLTEAWNAITGSWSYFIRTLFNPSWTNYFYWLLGLSIIVWILELIAPWREGQKVFRKDFWLDGFYMFFNYFFFYMIGFAALSTVSESLFNDFIGIFGISNSIPEYVQMMPSWLQLVVFFLIVDFVHWNIHRLLHRVPWLWEFHKVHHSVEQMGFAAHLRYHWMENIVYKSLQYIPVALIGGFDLSNVFIVHMIQTFIGHLNHANFVIPLGPFKYVLNNSKMHIWHHAKDLPEGKYGVNFGLTLSAWDYLFGTSYIPKSGRDIQLGFEEHEKFPKGFVGQFIFPFWKSKN